jgi:hypothetical protein
VFECDFNGTDLNDHWIKIPGVMDRFFVPQHIYQTLDIKMKVHPGMKTGDYIECLINY